MANVSPTECIEDLINKVKTLQQVDGKTIWVYGEGHLMDKTKSIKYPCAGIVYEGIRSTHEVQGSTFKQGLNCELIASILVLQKTSAMSGVDDKTASVALMDAIRDKILGTRSPTNHHWKFIVEAPADEKHGVVVWLQGWSTPIPMTPSKANNK